MGNGRLEFLIQILKCRKTFVGAPLAAPNLLDKEMVKQKAGRSKRRPYVCSYVGGVSGLAILVSGSSPFAVSGVDGKIESGAYQSA